MEVRKEHRGCNSPVFYAIECVRLFVTGLTTSLKVDKFIKYVKNDETFRMTLAKTVGLCTCVYAVFIAIDYAFMQGFFERHFGTGLVGFALYMALWALPIYLAVMQFFGTDFRKINELAYQLHTGVNAFKPVAFKYTIYRTVFYVVFLGMATAPIVLPYIGLPLSFILTSLVYTFLSFDAKWLLLNEKSFAEKVYEFQSAWAFFLGFGFIFGIVTILVPPFMSCATYAIFYPVFNVLVITCFEPNVNTYEAYDSPEYKKIPKALPVFNAAISIVDKVYAFLGKDSENKPIKSE